MPPVYDPEKPIVSVHIPKTAGKSVMRVLRNWFGDRFHHHAIDYTTGNLPPVFNLQGGDIVHGHFIPGRGTGLSKYYPSTDQWIIFLREPLEIAVSQYYYAKRVNYDGAPDVDCSLETFLENWLENRKAVFYAFMPENCKVNQDVHNRFMFIGVAEEMDASVARLATMLGFKAPASTPLENVSRPADINTANFRARFEMAYDKEYELWSDVRKTFQDVAY